MSETKLCSKCGIEKPLEEFHKDKVGKYGRRGECKVCALEYKRKFYDSNAEVLRAKKREYSAINREVLRKRNKRYYDKHAEQLREHQRKYRDSNVEVGPCASTQTVAYCRALLLSANRLPTPCVVKIVWLEIGNMPSSSVTHCSRL